MTEVFTRDYGFVATKDFDLFQYDVYEEMIVQVESEFDDVLK